MLDESRVVSFLGATEIFNRLKPDHLLPIARACRVVKFGEQARIVRQGEPGGELFIVAAGEVAVVLEDQEAGTEQAVLRLGPGQSFGEVSLLIESSRSATVKAVADTICIALAKKSFQSILEQLPAMGLEISRYLAARLHQQCQLTGFRFVSETQLVYDPELHKLFSENVLDRARAIPIQLAEGTLTVALTRPNDPQILQALRKDVPGLVLEPVACAWEDYEAFKDKYRPRSAKRIPAPESLSSDVSLSLSSGDVLPSPLAGLLGEVLKRGINQVTIAVKDDGCTVFDGAASSVTPFLEIDQPKILTEQIDSAFLNGNPNPYLGSGVLNVGEGRARVKVSKLPALRGPRYSLKLVDPDAAVPNLQVLIPLKEIRDKLVSVLRENSGAVLLSGSSRSGKTTTAYSLLDTICSEDGLNNAVSLEREPLTELNGISQVRTKSAWGTLLEAAQAQEPDMLFVDDLPLSDLPEFLNLCEAGRSILFACTASDPLGGLKELIASHGERAFDLNRLAAAVHLKTVTRQCPHCRVEYRPSPSVYDSLIHEKLADPNQLFFTSNGCTTCHGSKVLGRCQVSELLVLNSLLREMVEAGRPAVAIRKAALESRHLIPFLATARYLLKQGDLSATDALRMFGGQHRQ